MNLNPENLARHELIGLDVLVETSSEPGIVGLRALVVDETRNTFLLETERRVLRIPKKNANLIFLLPNGQKVEGSGVDLDLAAREQNKQENAEDEVEVMRDIGLDVSAPQKECNDPKCPFHDSLPYAARSSAAPWFATRWKIPSIMRKFEKKATKYERFEKRQSKIHAHNPLH